MMKGVDSPRDAPTRGGGCAALLDGKMGVPPSTKASATFKPKSMPPPNPIASKMHPQIKIASHF